jgi:hypothetical protein
MFKLVVILFGCQLFTGLAWAQSLKKTPAGNSGCSLYVYCDTKFKVSKSQDSSLVYTGECTVNEVSYGMICVKLLKPVDNLPMAEDLLIAYADYLKNNFGIVKAAGYGKGHRLNDSPDIWGILDYWQDSENDNWKIKAWTDGRYIGFMYAYSKKPLPEPKVDAFLDGFRLPETK